jgi:hypothetical protein
MVCSVVGVHLVQVSLLNIGLISSGVGLLPTGWRLRKFYGNAGGKQPMQRQLLSVQCKQHANLILSMNNCTSLVISRNDKNKQLALLSRHELALTARNTLFAI